MDDGLRLEDVTRAHSAFLSIDLRRGRAYFLDHRVTSVECSTDGAAVICTARVQGTAAVPYTSYLTFDATSRRLVSSECSCPWRGSCKHCTATLHALERELRSANLRAARRRGAPYWLPPPPKPAPDPAATAASWVRMLEVSNAVDLHRTRADGEGPHQIVFVVSFPDGGVSDVVVGIFREPVPGNVGERRMISAHGFDWTRDPAAAPGDHAVALKLGPPTMGYHRLRGEVGWRAFADIVASGRAFLERLERPGEPDLRLMPGGLRSGTLAFDEDPGGRQRPTVRVDGVGDAKLLSFLPTFYVDLTSGATGPVEVSGATAHMVHLWITGQPVTVEDAPAVARQLARTKLAVELPPLRVRAVRTIEAAPVIVLRLESQPREADGPAEPPWVRVFFDYGGRRVDPANPVLETMDRDEVVRITRDLRGELHETNKAYGAGLMTAYGAGPRTECMAVPRLSPFLLAGRVDALAARGVIVERAPDYAFEAVVADQLQVGLTEALAESTNGLGDYAVSLGIRVGDEVVDALPLVLAALREHTPRRDESLMVPLPDGRTVIVPAHRLEPLRRLLVELMESQGAGVSRARALALDPEVVSRSPKSLEKLRSAITSPRKTRVPKTLVATLREYQRDGFTWLMARRRAHLGALLADDMGLGKTVQTLALLLAEERDGTPSLVVCPKSVLGNWEAETARFAPSLRVHVHHGATRGARVERFEDADVVLTTYPILARDQKLFTSMRFSTAVLDEAQTIKTRGSKYTAAACALRADFRLALSGTPMENHLGELWSILRFTLPELFGDSRTFDKVFRRPIEREQDDEARHDLGRRLAPFFLRRRKEAVASELPPKTIVVERVPLEDAQREVYETVRASMDTRVRDALAAQGLARSHIVVLDALLKLRQAVCDPRLLAAKAAKRAGSAKLTALVEKLRQLVDEGRRILVFSQFVTMLDLVKVELRAEEIPFLTLTGQTQNRADVVAAFQRGDAPVFLLSLKAGGTGLNLTAADVVIHYDPWWNPAAEEQATDRAHRIGQDKPVLVYKLVGKDTIEEKILALQERKKALFSSVLDDGAGVAKGLTPADVAFLFAR